jgi:hypothetical protein
MTFEELPQFWQNAGSTGPVPETVLREVAQRSRALETTVRRRDRVEGGVALLLAPVFAACAVYAAHPVGRAGAVILALACLAIPLRLRAARSVFTPGALDRPFHAFVRAERERVRAQVELLRSVLWWYLLPLGVGVVLFFSGGTRSLPASAVYAVVVALFYAWLYRLNQQAVDAELLPRLLQLDAVLQSLDEDR